MKIVKLFIFNILSVGVSFMSLGQVDTTRFTNHGPQLFASMIQGSVFAKDKNGNDLVYTVVRGEPAHLLGYDVKTKKLVLDQPLPKADGAWDLAQSSDGTLYAPGANGSLFAHQPGTQAVKDLGVALEGETYLWSLTPGKDGEVFGATYPGCRVFRYHPEDGFSDVGKGALVEKENYVRSLAFYPKTGLLYAGVGSQAHLIEINPKTGEKKELLPEKFRSYEFVYGLEIVPGKDGNDRLFALITNGSITLVYNLKTREFEQEIEGMDMRAIAGAASGDAVYYTAKSELRRFDPSTSESSATVLGESVGTANAFQITDNGKIMFLTSGANLYSYDPSDDSLDKTKLQIPPQPIPIHSLLTAPDGKIWSGGYLAGGNATFDPRTGSHTFLPGLDQTEAMSVQGDQLFFGVYPKGKFYVFDTKGEWKPKEGNPKFLGQLEGQSRSFAQVSIPERQLVVFGMIPEYGKLGGAMATYDLVREELKFFDSPIEKQSIAALAFVGDYVLGGTTISGGLGKAPETKEAKLFGWDPSSGKTLFETVPVEGASALTGFIKGPDGNIWGMGDGTLFIFDPKGRKVLSTRKLYDFPPFKSHIWRSAFLVLHPDGNIYGTDWEKLFKLNPNTMELTQLAKDAALLVMGKDGTLFFKRGTDLWSYRP
jgi:streptogramin lyase